MSTEHEDRTVAVDEDSVASWEPGGVEYVVNLRGTLDDRWVESYVLTRRRSTRFSRFHLNRARNRVSFLCREADDAAELATVLENLKVLIAQTNRRSLAPALPPPDLGSGEEDADESIRVKIVPAFAAARSPASAEPAVASPSPEPATSATETLETETPETESPEAEPAAQPEAFEPAGQSQSHAEVSRRRVLQAIDVAAARIEAPVDPREARGRLAQWLGTAALVVEDGGSEDELVAALFVPGDSGTATPEDGLAAITNAFGERVASLVKTCEQAYGVMRPGGDPRLWSLFLRHAAPAARRIVCASRLRSARALLAQFRRLDVGRRLSFRDDNNATLQDYRAVVEACLEAGYSSHLVDDLDGVVLEMELAAGPASAERSQKRPLDRLTDALVQKIDLLEE